MKKKHGGAHAAPQEYYTNDVNIGTFRQRIIFMKRFFVILIFTILTAAAEV